MLFGDKSERTSKAKRFAIAGYFAVGLIGVGSVGYVTQNIRYDVMISQSSSAIGTSMTFQRSNADVSIKDIYTDLKKDVLIVRLGMSSGASELLPYKGSDYRIFVSSKATNSLKEMPIIFGRMSTDGDMFLVIPKPTNDVYSVFIMNTNYIGLGESSGITSTGADIDTSSISKALSNYNYSDTSNKTGSYTIQGDGYDYVSLRLTLDPSFKNAKYQPKTVKSNLLIENNDGSTSFNFEDFFNLVLKDSAVKGLNANYKKLEQEQNQLIKSKEEFQSRLAENPDDVNAKSSLDSVESKLVSLEAQMSTIADNLANYQTLTYDESYFANLQTKAEIIHTNKNQK